MQAQTYGLATFWQQSDIPIKSVAIILMVMSVATWIIILLRCWRLLYLHKLVQKNKQFWYASSFSESLALISDSTANEKNSFNPFINLASEALYAVTHHLRHNTDSHELLPLTEWLTSSLQNSINGTAVKMQSGLSILASVGSTSPFIGLFGTVWGIYHALIGISSAGHVNISEVAGPVGEALIMTAFGLVVAIPAVLGYNFINRGNKNLLNKLNQFAYELHTYFMIGAKPLHRPNFDSTANSTTNSATSVTPLSQPQVSVKVA